MSIMARALAVLIALVALFGVIGIFLPERAHVERSIVIDAAPTTVFALVDGFRSFDEWSPWLAEDNRARYERSGPDFGVGARLTFSSQSPQIGSGYLEVVGSEPYRAVRVHLDFGSREVAEMLFRVEPVESGAQLTWEVDSVFGRHLISRYFGLLYDSWIGADLESGLVELAKLAESLPKADWTDLEIDLVDVLPATIAYASTSSEWNHEAIREAFNRAHAEVVDFLARNQLEASGPPMAITSSYDEAVWRFDVAVPLADAAEIESDLDSEVEIRQSFAGEALRGVHVGPFADVSASWDKVAAYAAAHGFEVAGPSWEQYLSNPADTPEAELVTHLFLPVE